MLEKLNEKERKILKNIASIRKELNDNLIRLEFELKIDLANMMEELETVRNDIKEIKK